MLVNFPYKFQKQKCLQMHVKLNLQVQIFLQIWAELRYSTISKDGMNRDLKYEMISFFKF